MTTTDGEALDAMRAHHRTLEEQLRARVVVLAAAVAEGHPYEPAAGALVAYLAGQVLPHATAEEHTIYPVAAAQPGLAMTVSEMTAEHHALAVATEKVAGAASGAAAAGQAERIVTLFAAHVARENEVLLPALVDTPGAQLAELLAEMHRQTEGIGRRPGRPGPPR